MKEDQLHYSLSTVPFDDTSSLTYPNSHQEDQRAQEPTDLEKINGSMIQLYFDTEVDREEARGDDHMNGLPGKWMSSKMRLMRKMMGGEPILNSKQGSRALQESSNGNHSPADIINVRVCSNCSTTKTPLWRSGPQGPKSLCNACGIRQMKARRAMRAAAAAMSGGQLVPAKKVMKKEKRLDVDRTVPFKKRFKIAASNSTAPKKQQQIRFDEVTISLSKKKIAFQQTFPQEEKDAAILLMALSCGLIYG